MRKGLKSHWACSQDFVQALMLGGYKNISVISTLFGKQAMFSVGGGVTKISQTYKAVGGRGPELG